MIGKRHYMEFLANDMREAGAADRFFPDFDLDAEETVEFCRIVAITALKGVSEELVKATGQGMDTKKKHFEEAHNLLSATCLAMLEAGMRIERGREDVKV